MVLLVLLAFLYRLSFLVTLKSASPSLPSFYSSYSGGDGLILVSLAVTVLVLDALALLLDGSGTYSVSSAVFLV